MPHGSCGSIPLNCLEGSVNCATGLVLEFGEWCYVRRLWSLCERLGRYVMRPRLASLPPKREKSQFTGEVRRSSKL